VIENKLLSEAVLESIVGKHGVSPEAKKCLAGRLSELLKEGTDKVAENGKTEFETVKVTEEQK
jgi:chalcone isomerase